MATRQPLLTNPTNRVPSDASFAWQVHGALDAWGARIDVKVSILLAYQGGGFLLGLTSNDLLVTRSAHWSGVLAVALSLLLLAMLVGAAAIVPGLGPCGELRRQGATNWISFGQLRIWNASALAPRLAALTVDDELEILSRQLVALSRLNWWKHRFLQVSIGLTVLAMSAGALAVVGLYG